ncbi:MAG: hypothetical protein QOJ18_974 [Microbacteriaceae bacterium]|nr:hypothetical protein [Microbacteriaceae bacterium]
MSVSLTLAVIVSCVGSGLIAGVFFAFSSFVMPALWRLPAAAAIAAMQTINQTAVRPSFIVVLFGTAMVSIAATVWSLLDFSGASAGWMIGGSVSYLLGVIGLTAFYQVPLNEELARTLPTSQDAAGIWARYVVRWSVGNHIRAVAGVAAAAAFAVAIMVASR